MSVTRKIPLQSRFETTLTNLKTSSSCGCTSADLDIDILNPGEITTLRCVFDGGTIAKSQAVKIRLFSPEIPSASFVINMQFTTDPSQSAIQISSAPRGIAIDELWQKEHTYKYEFTLTVGKGVPRNAIDVSTSADFIKADMQGSLLSVTLDSPPVGKVDEFVTVAFPQERDSYSLKLPIEGRVRPLISATPQTFSFADVARGEDMAGEIQLEAVNANMDKPEVTLKGDWKLQSLERITERGWKLRVGLKALAGSDIRYGEIFVKGSWQGHEIRIPLTGNFKKATL